MRVILALYIVAAASPALAADEDPRWTASASGGVLARDGDAARSFATAAISRDLGPSYVRVSITRYDSSLQQANATLPSTFTTVAVSGGTTFGDWSVDGYASIGDRRYGTIRTPRGDFRSNVSRGSSVYALGGSLTYDAALSDHWFVSPSIAVDYGHTSALWQVGSANGMQELERVEQGITGTGSVALQYLFGPASRNIVAVSVGHIVTSNNAAATTTGGNGASPHLTEGSGVSDGWNELGATASFGPTKRLSLDLAGTRSFGAAAGDSSIATVGLRLRF